jgi:hypothetical protein
VLTAVFVVPVSAFVTVVPGVGGGAGMRQVVWQFAACELHCIMQVVTFPVCASRILSSASEWFAAMQTAVAARRNVRPRMTPPCDGTITAPDPRHHSAATPVAHGLFKQA